LLRLHRVGDSDVVGVFWQPNEYAINSNMQFGMKRYFDEETNEFVFLRPTTVSITLMSRDGSTIKAEIGISLQ
jgi:hypothetical protein